MTTVTLERSELPPVAGLRDLSTITEQVREGWERPDSWLNTDVRPKLFPWVRVESIPGERTLWR